jgi:hypothetical protein
MDRAFPPLAKVIKGMDVVDKINGEYGEELLVRTGSGPYPGRGQCLSEEEFSGPRLYQIRHHPNRVQFISKVNPNNKHMSEVAILTTSAGEMVLEFWPDDRARAMLKISKTSPTKVFTTEPVFIG